MKALTIAIGSFFSGSLLHAIPRRYRDGIELAQWAVNGVACYTLPERLAEIDKYNLRSGTFSLIITTFTPTNAEVNISSCHFLQGRKTGLDFPALRSTSNAS